MKVEDSRKVEENKKSNDEYSQMIDLLMNSNLKLRFLNKKSPKPEKKLSPMGNYIINQSDINFDAHLDKVDIYKFLKVKDLMNIPKYVVPRFKY